MIKKFPFSYQLDKMDCGPACLLMITEYYGRKGSITDLRKRCFATREGVSLLGISEAAESIGFRTLSATIPFDNLEKDAPVPVIAHWKQNHFIVVYKITRKWVHVADPAFGLMKLTHNEFKKGWIGTRNNDNDTGIVLFLEPTPQFYLHETEVSEKKSIRYFLNYMKPYRKYYVQLFLGFMASTLLSFIFPFLSQSIIDKGVANNNANFVKLILISQFVLYTAATFIEFVRSWILLHVGVRISITIISDFLAKLLKMPFSYFDNKTNGDLIQRIGDHKRIQGFLSASTLGLAFSLFNIIIFGTVLLVYNKFIFFIYIAATVVNMLWIVAFLKRRKALDYKQFKQSAANQSSMMQLINGMHEIKLQNAEQKKRWDWENTMSQVYRLTLESTQVGQMQTAGAFLINSVKNIFISYLSAEAVIEGSMTLGMMLSISYIIGQINGPMAGITGLIQSYQDAKISMDRLSEVHNSEEGAAQEKEATLEMIPEDGSIVLENVSFQYGGPHSPKVLDDISLLIPKGKKTAIVGSSGSGKTTLVKLLLKIYAPQTGEIKIGDSNLRVINDRYWRSICGVVSQDGYIFSDTIANNIAVSDDEVNKTKLLSAVTTANIKEFVQSLPLSYNTLIGKDGNGVSQGQKQRLLIARAVYKNPEFIFLDEATNSLDAINEKVIVENLEKFFKDKTVIIVAHRLSTVKNADQIVVLNKGKIAECGSHDELINKKGEYYTLIKEQLALG
jgi:ATP-binding cassette, subfamily B, bacterial